MKPSKLIFIRHAIAKKVEGCLPISDPDVIINDSQIKNLAACLPQDLVWYVSPLKRTIETAKALSKYVTLREIILEKDLVEQNFGDWAGKEIVEVWDSLKSNRSKHNFSFICPEFIPPSGESFLAQCERVSRWLEQLHFFDAQTVVVIAHAGTIRAALSHVLGIEPDKVIGVEILNLSLTTFEVIAEEDDKHRGGRFRLLSVNNIVN